MLLIESSREFCSRSSAQDVLEIKKKRSRGAWSKWQGSESYIGRKCDIFWRLEQVRKKKPNKKNKLRQRAESLKMHYHFLYWSAKRFDSFESISLIHMNQSNLIQSNQISLLPHLSWFISHTCIPTPLSRLLIIPRRLVTRGNQAWKNERNISALWIRWTLSESNDCCSNKRTSAGIVTPS